MFGPPHDYGEIDIQEINYRKIRRQTIAYQPHHGHQSRHAHRKEVYVALRCLRVNCRDMRGRQVVRAKMVMKYPAK